MIDVRPAVRDDADALCDAHVEGWRVGYRGLFADAYLDAPEFESSRRDGWRLARWLDSPEQAMFAGNVDGEVLGFAHCGPQQAEPRSPTTGEVLGFYLHPRAWGSGLASELMVAAEAFLRESFTEAVLWVLRDNPRARSFYEKAGWMPTGRELLWAGPTMPGVARPDPIAEVQYARTL